MTMSDDGAAPSPTDLSKFTLRRRTWRPHVIDFNKLVEAEYHGNGTTTDPFIVKWLQDDPENPKSYKMWRKCMITALVAFMTLCVSLASSAYTGAAKEIIADFNCSEEVFLLGLSLMVIGFALGPIIFGPLSEAVGRRQVLLVCMIFYIVWTAVCIAAQNIQTMIIFRFFCGTIGSAAFAIPAGHVADMFEADQRGVALAMFSAAPFLGPTLGPLIGGFISDGAGWRWLMAFLALYAAALTLFGLIFLPETYAPVLLRQRAQRLSRATGKVYMTKMDLDDPIEIRKVIKKCAVLPWALLFREPIILVLNIYMAVIYGTLYLCFAAFPIVFEGGYGWNAGQSGLAFLGILVGMFFGVAIIIYDNKRYVRLHNATGGFAPPESRLPTVIIGGGLAVIGLAWFAATASPNIHWIVPILAGIPFGTGFLLIFMSCINYLVDSYVIYAASVMAACSILRSGFGAGFPLFTTYMYNNLGVHWASAVPGFIALACFPFPILFYKYGPAIRRRCKYSAEAARILDSLKDESQKPQNSISDTSSEKDEEAAMGDSGTEQR